MDATSQDGRKPIRKKLSLCQERLFFYRTPVNMLQTTVRVAMAQVTYAFDRQSARSFDADGRMRVKDCVLSTAEINPYNGDEIPGWEALSLDPDKIYNLFRDPDELSKAVPSFEGVPLLIKHVPQTAGAPQKQYIGGSIHSVTFDGKHLRGDLLVMDGAAIDLIESGTLADLSCGYRYVVDMTPGSHDGKAYDGIMTRLDGNHVALVSEGRATGAHVADSAFKPPVPTVNTQRGVSDMAFPENEEEVKQEAPEAGQEVAPVEAVEETSLASVGQALKHIAMLLEANTAALREFTGGSKVSAAEEVEQNVVGANDLELGVKIEGAGSEDVPNAEFDKDADPMPAQAEQEGTPARGGPTPHSAMDAKIQKAVLAERKRAAGVSEAQREVRPILGDVYGMDSAADIYREALRHVGVDLSAVQKGAEKAAWQAFKAVRGVAAGARAGSAEFALDSQAVEKTQSGLLAHLEKISVKG